MRLNIRLSGISAGLSGTNRGDENEVFKDADGSHRDIESGFRYAGGCVPDLTDGLCD